MDPFVKYVVKGEKFKTPVATNGHRNPKWEYSFVANLDGDEDAIHLRVFNKGNVTDDLIGRADVELPNLDMSGSPQWYSVRDPDDFSKECGEISLSILFEGNGLPASSRALTTHTMRSAGSPSAVQQGAAQPMSPPSYAAPQQNYASPPPPQQQTYAAPPQQMPAYGQPQYGAPAYGQPQQPQVVYGQPPQQMPPAYAPMQPAYAPMPQPGYAPMQPAYAPAPTVVVQQSYPPAQPQYAPPPQQHQSPTSGIANMMGSFMNAAAGAFSAAASAMTNNRGRFDRAGYLQLHPDVARAGMDGWTHYVNHGHGEGRQIRLTNGATGKFDSQGYLQIHPDVARAGMDAFTHYKNHGFNENREIIVSGATFSSTTTTSSFSSHSSFSNNRGRFDRSGYLQLHPDVARAGMDGWTHYVNHGHGEGRRIQLSNGSTGKFDSQGYLNLHPDVARAGMDAFTHYKNHGFNENREIVISP